MRRRTATLGLLLAAALATAGPARGQDPGLTAWAEIETVLLHPRCANCHVSDGVPVWSGPSYGPARPHAMFIGGDPDRLNGAAGATCDICHGATNVPRPHGPPGAEVWHLPPAAFAWFGRSGREVCRQLRDPARNGDRSVDDLARHVSDDPLVLWGWDPGPGREPPPLSPARLAELILDWGANGTPCPPR